MPSRRVTSSTLWMIVAAVAGLLLSITLPIFAPLVLGFAGAFGAHLALMKRANFQAMCVTGGFGLGYAAGFVLFILQGGFAWNGRAVLIGGIVLGYGVAVASFGVHHARQRSSWVPRVRLTILDLMVAVAFVALAMAALSWYDRMSTLSMHYSMQVFLLFENPISWNERIAENERLRAQTPYGKWRSAVMKKYSHAARYPWIPVAPDPPPPPRPW